VTFLVTRLITRSIRAGRGPFHDNAVGGVHVHHAALLAVFVPVLAYTGAIRLARPGSWWTGTGTTHARSATSAQPNGRRATTPGGTHASGAWPTSSPAHPTPARRLRRDAVRYPNSSTSIEAPHRMVSGVRLA